MGGIGVGRLGGVDSAACACALAAFAAIRVAQNVFISSVNFQSSEISGSVGSGTSSPGARNLDVVLGGAACEVGMYRDFGGAVCRDAPSWLTVLGLRGDEVLGGRN